MSETAESPSLLHKLDALQNEVLDELDALDARIQDLIKQTLHAHQPQAAVMPITAPERAPDDSY